VCIRVEGPDLDGIGLLCDFLHLKSTIREIIQRLDHQFLNDLEAFRTVNPSAENMAKYFYDESARQMPPLPPGARITDITVWETDTTWAQYRPGP
jgi:6-pyruvoyltetrahydropterin/6-carboxytetrahydropterin synthase